MTIVLASQPMDLGLVHALFKFFNTGKFDRESLVVDKTHPVLASGKLVQNKKFVPKMPNFLLS